MTFVFSWPVLYGLVLLGVLMLWVKTDNRNQRTEVRQNRSLLSVLRSLISAAHAANGRWGR